MNKAYYFKLIVNKPNKHDDNLDCNDTIQTLLWQIIDKFIIGVQDTRVAMISFREYPWTELYFDTYFDKAEIQRTVQGVVNFSGGINLARAMERARVGVSKIIVMVGKRYC